MSLFLYLKDFLDLMCLWFLPIEEPNYAPPVNDVHRRQHDAIAQRRLRRQPNDIDKKQQQRQQQRRQARHHA